MIRIRHAALALLALAGMVQAQVVPISSLPSGTTLSGSEPVPAVQSGHTVKITPNQIVTLASTTLQAKDAQLDAVALLTPVADRCWHWTSSTALALDTCTSFSRGLWANADAGSWRTALGVAGLGGDTTYAFRANNLSDLASASTSRTNLGLGSIATQSAASVTITGGSITGITDLAVADGGSGASTAAGARTNYGLVIGTDVEAHDSDLTTIGGLSPSNDDFLQRKAGSWTNRTIAQVKADLGLPASADVQIFNVSGTWTKPAFGSVTRVIAFAGGGGGGNGALVATSTAATGGGGGGGGYGRELTFVTSSLGSTETVTVGAGGTAGVAGGNTSFGSWLTVYGGGFGSAGAAGVGSAGGGGGGANTVGGNASGATGGAAGTLGGSSAGGSANVGAATNFGASGGGGCANNCVSPAAQGGNGPIIFPGGGTGGGGGGSITVANVASGGSPGGVSLLLVAGLPGGAVGVAGSTASAQVPIAAPGSGGGGGGASVTGNGGAGGAGQTPAGGGGGGGAAQTGFAAGAGGTGGSGKVIVITQ